MRPARKGPENAGAAAAGRGGAVPSMRPARKGPENREMELVTVELPDAFNEAGPQGAGKRAGPPTTEHLMGALQ